MYTGAGDSQFWQLLRTLLSIITPFTSSYRFVDKSMAELYLTALLSLSIYLPIRLNPRRGHQTGSREPSAGG